MANTEKKNDQEKVVEKAEKETKVAIQEEKKTGSIVVETELNEPVVAIVPEAKSEPSVSVQPEKQTDSDEAAILSTIRAGLTDVIQKDIPMATTTVSEKIKPDELITVRSVVRGGFNWKCVKSGIRYRWPSIGHPEIIPYDDLYQMYTNKKEYLTKPNLLIEDERVIRVFKLLEVYKAVASVQNLDAAVNNPIEMRKVCEQAKSIGMRDLLVERLSQMRNNSSLTNADVIDVAQEVLSCEIVKT